MDEVRAEFYHYEFVAISTGFLLFWFEFKFYVFDKLCNVHFSILISGNISRVQEIYFLFYFLETSPAPC